MQTQKLSSMRHILPLPVVTDDDDDVSGDFSYLCYSTAILQNLNVICKSGKVVLLQYVFLVSLLLIECYSYLYAVSG